VEVRGAAPGTRELDALAPGRIGTFADAIVLSGGSAFGLATCDGVMRDLAAQGRGFATSAGVVPIVPAAVVFDLANGEPVAPSARHGSEALAAARPIEGVQQGRVGAGTGVRWNNLGIGDPAPGGFGIGQTILPEGTITAVAVVNALGTVVSEREESRSAFLSQPASDIRPGEQTTLIAIVTDIACDHSALGRCCVAGHDSLARMIVPAHTMFDGDVVFASTTNSGMIALDGLVRLTVGVELAVEMAITRAVSTGSWLDNTPGS
jgi:L-aminopeptidase/D-esterase-like protein